MLNGCKDRNAEVLRIECEKIDFQISTPVQLGLDLMGGEEYTIQSKERIEKIALHLSMLSKSNEDYVPDTYLECKICFDDSTVKTFYWNKFQIRFDDQVYYSNIDLIDLLVNDSSDVSFIKQEDK